MLKYIHWFNIVQRFITFQIKPDGWVCVCHSEGLLVLLSNLDDGQKSFLKPVSDETKKNP